MTPPMFDEILAGLTENQREAVLHTEGPLLVLAGPGSGKTRVITCRIANLIHQSVRPGQILAITFTNKAAAEMKQRVETMLPGNRVWISTFHSLGVRLMRQYADQFKLDRNFTIYDQSDRVRLIKSALEAAQVDSTRFTPETIQGAISKAKNQLLLPDAYAKQANDYFSQVTAQVYPVYEKKMRDANAVDFDDLLLWPALALRSNPELRAELDARFRYVLVDEYQDTNKAQYAIARGLTMDHPNLCVVGDPDQCLPRGTLIATPDGEKPIEILRAGDIVLSACGWGKSAPMKIDQVMVNPFRGKLVRVEFAGGGSLRATPNHICFARLRPTPDTHFVYLMWKRGTGYRLGTTRGVRVSGDGLILSGLQVRTNQEVADAVWILRTCKTSAEARFNEHFLAIKYGIPTMVFFVRGRRMAIEQHWIDQLYRDIDTEAAAKKIMADFHLDRRFPHHRPGAVVRGNLARRHVVFTMFGDNREKILRSWHEHRIQLVTSGEELRVLAAKKFPVRPGQRGTWRIETARAHYEDGVKLAEQIAKMGEFEFIPRARLTPEKAFLFMPASHLHPGMVVPVLQKGKIVERTIKSVAWDDYDGPVYDLSIPDTRNFIANRTVVHNSIYRWRGSDIRNILDFERDFPHARVINLGENFRSTKAILRAADHLIGHNKQRKPKELYTANVEGSPVGVLMFETGVEEADLVAKRIREAVESSSPLPLYSGGEGPGLRGFSAPGERAVSAGDAEPLTPGPSPLSTGARGERSPGPSPLSTGAKGETRRHYRDFAILLRVNALSRGLEAAFVRQRVPFQIVRGVAFFERKENRDVLAYLRLLLNPRDDLSFARAVNEPARGVGKTSLEHLRKYAEPRELSLLEAAAQVNKVPAIRGKAAMSLAGFALMMSELRQVLEATPDEVMRQVIDRSGYRRALKESADPEDQERLANIEELITAAHQFHAEDNSRTISDFIENITLASDVDGWDEKQDCVAVMTLHAAKGLEFPVVYMLAMEQGILPHERSIQRNEELEEERRLAFVGMTRAQEELYLSYARMREFRGQTLYAVPSMFLEELPRDGIDEVDLSSSSANRSVDKWRGSTSGASQGWYDTGFVKTSTKKKDEATSAADDPAGYEVDVLVHHDVYGTGRITDVSGHGVLRKLKIRFASGERKFLAAKAKLAIVQKG